MKKLTVKPTSHCPKIIFDPQNTHFEISGISRPENVCGFYYPVINWLHDFHNEVIVNKTFHFDMDNPAILKIVLTYFNSSTAKFLYEIIGIFKSLSEKGEQIKIQWYFDEEDDDIREAGEELSEMIEIPFEYIVQSR